MLGTVKVLILLLITGLAVGSTNVLAQEGSAEKGRIQFYSKGCVVCHGLEGKGGEVGPDLRKLRARGFSALQVAQTFWNHGPTMRLLQKQKGIRRPEFHRDEMMHLLAFLATPGVADASGDPAHGARIFQKHGCVQCHSFQGQGGDVGPELGPIAKGVPGAAYWAQRMWNHVDLMAEKTLEKGVPWPLFRDNELADLIAFLQKGSKAAPKQP